MLFKSINHALKDVFYTLEKCLAGKHFSPPDSLPSERIRLSCLNHRSNEASLASGEFLSRARRGETLKPDHEDTHELVKDFVRLKTPAKSAESRSTVESTGAAPVASRPSLDELPIFGLKASLHASTEHLSFDAWKNIHQKPPSEISAGASAEISSQQQDQSINQKVAPRSWRELSVHTALRLIDHPNTPADVLMELANHIDAEVRAQVADNANTPKEAIMLLLKDESVDVRMSLAECYPLGATMLEILTEDENPYVCDRAERTLQRLSASENPGNVSVIRSRMGFDGARTAEVKAMRALA